MSDKDQALRLADALEFPFAAPSVKEQHAAAAELRRLHAENQSLRAALAQAEPVAEEIKQQALDALNRMQSILMMSDGRHPRDVLRTYIQLTAAPLPQQQAEPVQGPFALPCPTPKACREHCCSGHCIPRATSPQQAEPPCDHCRSPLFCATSCRVCGRNAEPQQNDDGEWMSVREAFP